MRGVIAIVLFATVVIHTLEAVPIPEGTVNLVSKFPAGCYDGSIKPKECCKITAQGSSEGSKSSSEGSRERLTFDLNNEIGLFSSRESSHESGNNWWDLEYFADPKDCHKYFTCNKGKEQSKKCPGKHQFSPELKECVYTGSSKCQELSVPTTTTKKPTTQSPSTAEPTTSKKPTTTAVPSTPEAENPSTFPSGCYDGSIKAKECCKLTATGSGEKSKERFTFDLNYDSELYASGEGSHESGSNWWDSEYFADPKDCHKYFTCNKGKEQSKKCPGKHQFSPELRDCVYTGSNKCQELSVPSTTKPTTQSPSTAESTRPENPTTTKGTTTEAPPAETTTIVTTEAPLIPNGCYDTSIHVTQCCSWAPNNSTFPDRKNCFMYYVCEDGIPVRKRCPYTYRWSIEQRKCVYTSQVQCDWILPPTLQPPPSTIETTHRPTTTAKPTTPTTTVKPTTQTTTIVPTTEAPHLPNGCYDTTINVNLCCSLVPNNTVILPDPTNCFMYYECENGIPVRKRCPYTYRWSLEQRKCVYTSQVQCDWILPTTSQQPEITETTTTQKPTTLIPPTTQKPIFTTTTQNPTTAKPSTTTVLPSSTTSKPTPTKEVSTPPSTRSTTSEIPTIPTEATTPSTEASTPPRTSGTTTVLPSSTTSKPTPTKEVSTPPSTRSTTSEIPTIPTEATTPSTEASTPPRTSGTTTVLPSSTTSKPTSTDKEPEWTTRSPSTTTEFEPTADPNGSCGTAPYKCRHGLISAEECCKGVPYWEDRLLQNNDNCGTYFQCVHEKPEIRICPPGIFWNADVCRCEWKEISTCNF